MDRYDGQPICLFGEKGKIYRAHDIKEDITIYSVIDDKGDICHFIFSGCCLWSAEQVIKKIFPKEE